MNRNSSVDLLKLIASFFVICIHTKTWSSRDHFSADSSSFILDSVARFAVPFFFVTAGYYAPRERDKYRKRMKKLTLICLIWSCVYMAIRQVYAIPYPFFVFTNVTWADYLLNALYRLANFGFERHLWFLPAYMTGLFLLRQLRQTPGLMLSLAAATYLAGLAGQGWGLLLFSQKIIAALHNTYFTRDGLFFAFPCMAAGYYLRIVPKPRITNTSLYLLLLSGLFLLQYLEAALYYSNYQYTPDYTLSTLFLAVALLAFVLNGKQVAAGIAGVSRLAAGVYLLHPLWLYVFFLYGQDLFATTAWPYVYTPLLFVLSLGSAWLLSRFSFTRSLIAS